MSYDVTFPSNHSVPSFIAFFTNGVAAVCDQWGQQMPKYQVGWHQMTIQALEVHGYNYKTFKEVLGVPLTTPPSWWSPMRDVDAILCLKYLEFPCMDCGELPTKHNTFIARDDLWLKVHPNKKGTLCLTCFEKRLERKLVPEDFLDSPVNWAHVPCFRPNPTPNPRN